MPSLAVSNGLICFGLFAIPRLIAAARPRAGCSTRRTKPLSWTIDKVSSWLPPSTAIISARSGDKGPLAVVRAAGHDGSLVQHWNDDRDIVSIWLRFAFVGRLTAHAITPAGLPGNPSLGA